MTIEKMETYRVTDDNNKEYSVSRMKREELLIDTWLCSCREGEYGLCLCDHVKAVINQIQEAS